jgi:hypothetical protein
MGIRNSSAGRGWSVNKADNLTAIWADCLENVGVSKSHNTMGLHDLLHFLYTST